jgi:glucose/arabinose dehydrogenase
MHALRRWRPTLTFTVLLLAAWRPSAAQLAAVQVASGFTQPVAYVQDPTNPSVWFVVEQGGRIRIQQNGALAVTDFLDLTNVTEAVGEQGLLGLAFAPDYATSGRLFVNFTNLVGDTVVARFTRSASNPHAVDLSSRFDLMWPNDLPYIDQPFANHNGGHLAFGPDGYLYLGMGDGGSGNDPGHLAQTPSTLLGKMLRIDVSVLDSDPEGYDIPATNPWADGSSGVLGEIWAFGLRNPWRWSFDAYGTGATGAMLIADVGQNGWEEVNYEPAAAGGRNYGWRNREGAHDHIASPGPFTATLPVPNSLIDPIIEYSRADGQAITGGFVYRGTALGPAFFGRYFFGDFGFGRIWSVALTNGVPSDLRDHTIDLGAGASLPSSFSIDESGELYVVNYNGTVHKIVPAGFSPGCATLDPFLTLGGGTCANGGWLPPNFAPPPPPPPPAPTASDSTVCSTPDPFTSLGGGICVSGGWLPPGFGTPASPPPPPPPASGSTGCSTPDPFTSLGGGTCVNGGWLPPGFGTPPSPPSPPPPPPAGGSTGCTMPDPFVILGGGTCVNGGWLPPGFVIGG